MDEKTMVQIRAALSHAGRMDLASEVERFASDRIRAAELMMLQAQDKHQAFELLEARVAKLEPALIDAAFSLMGYEQSSGQGNGFGEAVDICQLLGYEGGTGNEEVADWLTAEFAKRNPPAQSPTADVPKGAF